jgi:energy-coupling factor transporter ATP-binding protein EcfA2
MDSGWIGCEDVTTLVGINEAGKSNLILALWKLNPAREGDIDLLHDMPTKEYTAWRKNPGKYEFITACFQIENSLSAKIAGIAKCSPGVVSNVIITRYFDGEYSIEFPNVADVTAIQSKGVVDILSSALKKINVLEERTQGEAGIKEQSIQALTAAEQLIAGKTELTRGDSADITEKLQVNVKAAAKSEISPVFETAISDIEEEFKVFDAPNPKDAEGVFDLVFKEMPSFVYYSNYGNLDAQIYLPHAVKLVNGESVPGFDNAAKVRTLKVLFEFVNLSPIEVYDLGKNPEPTQGTNPQTRQPQMIEPTATEIEDFASKKEEREIMLQSASSRLTREFAEWWKQGSYKFRLHADGDYFRILVSDDKRPEEIALELRSTGLQWFLSFFLVFLVESKNTHKGAILLLDEAGLTLHPLAQKNLVEFFDGLAMNNQIIHTTHSPFLINTANIDRVKVVYSDNNGLTVCSANLRESDDRLNEKSVYAVHAALGLSVSDILLNGCQPIIVEGVSDQYYLNAIKLFLIRNGKLTPSKEIVFMPSGGCTNKAVNAIASLVCGRNGELPCIILDSDKIGKKAAKSLADDLYKGAQNNIVEVDSVVGFEDSEIEDLMPSFLFVPYLAKLFSHLDDEFKPTSDKAILPQIEEFARNNSVDLEVGWKVSMAKSVKTQLLKEKTEISESIIERWIKLFGTLSGS